MLIVLIVVLVSMLSKVDLTKYVEITADGYNGYGHVTYEIDSEKLLKDVYGVDGIDKLSLKKLESWYQLNNIVFDIDGSTKKASNGDKVVFKIKNLETIAKKSGIALSGNDTIEYTVAGLEEPKGFSANDIFDAEFVGFDGAGCVELKIKDNSLPFNITKSWGNSVYADDYYSISINTPGSEGSLKNGDEFRVTISADSSTSETLLDKYGWFVDEETEAVFTVSGLGEAEEFDVFDYIEFNITGVDGSAELKYNWPETEVTVGNIKLKVDYPDSSYFTLSSTASVPTSTLTVVDGSESSYNEEQYIGSFYIECDKTWNIAGNDTINFKVTSGYNEIEADDYATNGVIFKNVTKEITVDSGLLDRYITSEKQFDKDSVKTFAESITDKIEQYIYSDWAYMVHDSWSFTCYDQEVTSCKVSKKAYFVCTSKRSNSYVFVIPYECKVKDSEIDGEETIYIYARVYSPLVKSSTQEISATDYNISISRLNNAADITKEVEYLADGDDSITEVKLN